MPHITSIGEILFDDYKDFKKLGGAPFNFFYHINKLTGKGNFISRIGNDESGKEILNFFKEKDLSAHLIQIDNSHPTGKASANLDDKKIPHWVIEENAAYDFLEHSTEIEDEIKKSDCLYFGTLAQRNSVSGNTIRSLFNRRIKYFCDLNIRQNYFSKEILELSLTTADVLKVNEDELIILNNFFLKSKYDLVSSAVQLKNNYNIELLCVTCGERGSYLFMNDEIDFFRNPNINPVDTVGAGDAYAAVLCLGYLKRLDLKKLNELAGNFAGQIVTIEGALPPNDEFYNNLGEIL